MSPGAVTTERADGTAPAPARARPKPRAASSPWGVSVMVVDDDAADASLVLGVMKRHPSVAGAVAFSDAEQALAALASGQAQPDLILLDISMPKTNGFAFMTALEAIPYLCRTPVVLLTTSRFLRDVEQAKDTIACGYIVKPDNFEDLRRRLDGVVKQTISGRWS